MHALYKQESRGMSAINKQKKKKEQKRKENNGNVNYYFHNTKVIQSSVETNTSENIGNPTHQKTRATITLLIKRTITATSNIARM